MADEHVGQTVVIFVSQRTVNDDTGYAEAAVSIERLARSQPGYRGIVSARDAKGYGITVSYWADEAAAIAWRHEAEHAAIRLLGRQRWYDSYEVVVAAASRSYRWYRQLTGSPQEAKDLATVDPDDTADR